jgi:hypothetical protein
MASQFDIFLTEDGGSVLWRGTADTFEEARVLVQKSAARSPGAYVVVNLQTGKKLVIHSNDLGSGREVKWTS